VHSDPLITVGARLEFELRGREAHRVVATVVEVLPAALQLITPNGRKLIVPNDAVEAIREIPTTSAATQASQPSNSSGRESQDPSTSQSLLARDLKLVNLVREPPVEASQLEPLRQALERIRPAITGRHNRHLADTALAALNGFATQLGTADLAIIEKSHVEIAKQLARVPRGRSKRISALTAALRESIHNIEVWEEASWASSIERHSSPPQVTAIDLINVTRDANGEFELPVRILLQSDANVVRDVRLVLDKYRGLKLIGAQPFLRELHPGKSATLRARFRDNRKQGARAEVRLETHLTYVDASGSKRQSTRQNINVKILGKEKHEDIPNPFEAYAGGLPIAAESGMFFGRETLVDDFVRELSKTPGGRCFALYGQQRTGKSSVLTQVHNRLIAQGAIVARLSLGTIDRRSITVDFMEEVLDQFRDQTYERLPKDLAQVFLSSWPDSRAIERRPLRSFQRGRDGARSVLRRAGHTGVPFVVVVDEFTYLQEVLRRRGVDPSEHNELRDFMRQLKGLLEARMFSALLLGQDTMPHFLDSYPNEFSVMTTRKLDYLTADETQALADVPIRTKTGTTRYTGYALSTIAGYTDGHPFFTQILCDRIVRNVNSRKRSQITQSDVEEAIENLVAGQDRIEQHKFDCLVTADNTKSFLVNLDQEDGSDDEKAATPPDDSRAAVEVLTRIALMGGPQNNPVPVERLQLEGTQSLALNDLLMRGVLRESELGVNIRVLLYADYLRRRYE
jgi:hypothetical protein